jgi:hypothetical protein
LLTGSDGSPLFVSPDIKGSPRTFLGLGAKKSFLLKLNVFVGFLKSFKSFNSIKLSLLLFIVFTFLNFPF